MTDYVLYHNADGMGYTADGVGAESFSIVTDKDLPAVIGSRVWMITGEGEPRTYKLFGHFTPTDRHRIGEDRFSWEIVGPRRSGVQLRRLRWPILNHLPWWPAFLHSQANFSLGLQPIAAHVVPELEKALAQVTKYESRTP